MARSTRDSEGNRFTAAPATQRAAKCRTAVDREDFEKISQQRLIERSLNPHFERRSTKNRCFPSDEARVNGIGGALEPNTMRIAAVAAISR